MIHVSINRYFIGQFNAVFLAPPTPPLPLPPSPLGKNGCKVKHQSAPARSPRQGSDHQRPHRPNTGPTTHEHGRANRGQQRPLHDSIQRLSQPDVPEGRPLPLQEGYRVGTEQPGGRLVADRVQDQRQDETEKSGHPGTVETPGELDEVLGLGSAYAGVEGQRFR